jgi:capsular polysaccharide export protein
MSSGSVIRLLERGANGRRDRAPSASRHVLLLQGPVGPFFANLHRGLLESGFEVTRLTFGPADRYFNRGLDSVRFRGGAEDFSAWLDKFTQNKSFGSVVLFGANRPLHAVACSYFKALGVPVLCLEEGYVRPGYITVELDGNNYQSPVAGQFDETQNWGLKSHAPASGASSFKQMAKYGFVYYALQSLFASYGERQGFHKKHRTNIGRELFCWARNFVRSKRHGMKHLRNVEYLLENHHGSYFIVPFQVADDAQLTGPASNAWNNDSLALAVIASFAKFAHVHQRLVFKVHPLERGHSDSHQIVAEIAKSYGVASRVHVVDTGSIGVLTRHSAGMITINSTSGFSAINHGVPLAVLGMAIYGIPSLCSIVRGRDDINDFWKNGFVADRATRMNYVDYVRAHCLLPGDYYLKDESRIAIDGVIARLSALVSQDRVADHADRVIVSSQKPDFIADWKQEV